MKKFLLSLGVAALPFIPSGAFAAPTLTYGYKTIGYGQVACLQKAEAKLYQISATNVNRNNTIHVFGGYPNTTIAISCRNNGEVMVVVAGNDAYLLRDEILSYF